MSACEKCWGDAYLMARATGKSQAECYFQILKESETSCTPKEQAGQFWDSVKCRDRREQNGI